MATFDGVDIAGDAIKFHAEQEYTFESTHIRNESGGTLTNVEIAGQPLQWVPASDHAILVTAGNEANANAIVAEKRKIESLANLTTETVKTVIVARGPATLWSDGIPDNDVEGNALNKTTLKTSFEAVDPPIIVRESGTVLSETQTK